MGVEGEVSQAPAPAADVPDDASIGNAPAATDGMHVDAPRDGPVAVAPENTLVDAPEIVVLVNDPVGIPLPAGATPVVGTMPSAPSAFVPEMHSPLARDAEMMQDKLTLVNLCAHTLVDRSASLSDGGRDFLASSGLSPQVPPNMMLNLQTFL